MINIHNNFLSILVNFEITKYIIHKKKIYEKAYIEIIMFH